MDVATDAPSAWHRAGQPSDLERGLARSTRHGTAKWPVPSAYGDVRVPGCRRRYSGCKRMAVAPGVERGVDLVPQTGRRIVDRRRRWLALGHRSGSASRWSTKLVYLRRVFSYRTAGWRDAAAGWVTPSAAPLFHCYDASPASCKKESA